MKKIWKFIKGIVVLLLGLVALGVGGIYFFEPRFYNDYVEKQLIAAAEKAQIKLSLKNLRLRPVGARVDEAEVFIPKALFLLAGQNLSFNVGLLSLLQSNPQIDYKANLYGGEFSGDSSINLSDSTWSTKAELKNVKISEHPQVASLGITDGLLSMQVQDFKGTSTGPESGTTHLELKNVNKPLPTFISVPVNGGKMKFEIPDFSNLNLTLDTVIDKTRIDITKWTGDSSLGKFNIVGQLGLGARGKISHVNLNGNVSMTEDGYKFFGPYLPLMNNRNISPETRDFKLTISGDARTPLVYLSPLEE